MATNGVDLSLSGLASGLDWKTLVQELASAERAPETQWQSHQATLNLQNAAFGQIKSLLTTLQTDVQALKDPTLYSSAAAASSDPTLSTATAVNGATLGSFTFNVTQLATAAQLNGTTDVGAAISSDGNLANVTIGSAGFATPITAGTFTVNGQQVTIATTDSLQQVFGKIAAATGNAVAASYNSTPGQPTSDKITLTSSSPIVLGSATDTSNFLQVAQLYNNGTGSVTSHSALGSVLLNANLADSNLRTAVTGDTTGQGQFTINGVAISYNVSSDSIQNIIDRINASAAGVTASYNAQTDGFVLTNRTTGDVGIAAHDVTGNFLAATGLASGALARGQNLLYTLNGGSTQLVSQSNTISQSSSNITGLSVTALAKGISTVTVSSDTGKVQTAIQNFVSAYNSVQTYISSQTSSSTDSSGKVTAGILAADPSANGIASSLRSLSFAPSALAGLPSSLNQLADLGIQTNGQNNTIAISDTTALTNALTSNLSHVQSLFADPKNGLAVQLDNFLTNTVGDNGTLTQHQANLTTQSQSIDQQVAALEKTITSDSARWTTEFQAMEQAQAQINQQMSYLTQQINNGTL
ncbi:MAG TPA: flagellar filament capping protein FliD [Verrucomicrobiae bacterium]|nr:flagellar filament capping protein FliD [Verrucomicrobiae bacterium]